MIASVVHATQFSLLFRRELRLPTLQLALGSCHCHALAGAHAEQIDLELGEGGEDVEEHLAHRVVRIMDLTTKGEDDALGGEFVPDGPGVRNGPCETIELRHDECVAAADGGERISPGLVARGWCR